MKAGLAHRPAVEILRDTLAWEQEMGLGRVRKSGISAEREADLLEQLAGA